MTPEEYFNMFTSEGVFDHNSFLTCFADRFSQESNSCDNYLLFRNLVNRYHTIFVELRKLSSGKVYISKKLWKAFYAKYVVPIRKNKYPHEQERIEQRRAEKKNH